MPSNWLRAADLDGKAHLFTIKSFTVEKMGDEQRPVVWFAEDQRGLGLNITNATTIEQITGSPDTDDWMGARIVVYPTETDFRGKRVDCIRIRAPKKGAKLPEPPTETTPDDDVPF
jgi:hypothetical protein